MLPPSIPDPSCRQFSLSDIKSATNNFSDALIIGKGSFGNVYKATIATGHEITTAVAVKRRKSDSKQGPKEFSTEVSLLSTLRHANLISLIGYCLDEDANEMILVYEYMANGTLADHIYKRNNNSSSLKWEQRLMICIGVARGLEYLHTGTGINQMVIHCDMKCSNILLDENWAPKISDFGLCETHRGDRPYSSITANVKGTAGYMDPNYCRTRELSTKSDVYAFGVVLLEVFSGRRSLDFDAADLQKKLVYWAKQCIREGVAKRIMDPCLKWKISDEGLLTFLDIAVKCLQDSPRKRPTMADVVAKLESALASEYNSDSSSSEDEFVKIYFGQVDPASSSASSDVDRLGNAVETWSGKSDITIQDPGSESKSATINRTLVELKSSENILEVPADVSMHSTITATSEAPFYLSHGKDDVYEKLCRRMNLPRVAVDNGSCKNATVIQINTNTQGILLEVIQVLTDFNLLVTEASRTTSDGLWFMDVFSVTDQEGNKVTDEVKLQIEEVLDLYSSSTTSVGRNYEIERSISDNHMMIELIGNDRPGLLSDISAILTDFQFNVVSAEAWSHNTRTAAVMHVNDEETKSAVFQANKLSKIKKLLSSALKGDSDNRDAKITISHGCPRFDRRLHQMMFADRGCERGLTSNDKQRPKVDVEICYDKDYSTVNIRCKNKPKVLFDTICTLTDLMYFVFHGNVYAKGSETHMEFWIRHIDGSTIKSDAERQRVICHLEAAIERRVSEGLKIEIRAKDRVGLLCDVTRIIRKSNLTIIKSEVTTTGDKSVFSFIVDDSLGHPVDLRSIDYIRTKIERTILHWKGNHEDSYQDHEESITTSNFKQFIKLFMKCFGFLDIRRISFWSRPVTMRDVCIDYLL